MTEEELIEKLGNLSEIISIKFEKELKSRGWVTLNEVAEEINKMLGFTYLPYTMEGDYVGIDLNFIKKES